MARNPLSLAKYEILRFRGPLPRLALAFILLIPMLYGCIYLASNWDPYGRLNNVPVAVVNHDRTTTLDDKPIHAGQDFVESLHKAGKFRFIDTTSADAEQGLAAGRYYLVITVPEAFSTDLISGEGDQPQRAEIMLRRNDANGFVIGTITNSAKDSITNAIDETAVKSYFEAVFANLTTIRASLAEAADGAHRLDSGLETAEDGSAKLASGAADAAEGAGKLSTGAATLAAGTASAHTGATTLAGGVSDLADGADKLAAGSRQVADGTQQLADTLDPVLSAAAKDLPEIQKRLTTVADEATDLSTRVSTGSGALAATVARVDTAIASLGKLTLDDGTQLSSKPAYQKVRGAADDLAEHSTAIAGHASSISTVVGQADTALHNAGDLSSKAKEAQAKIDQLNDGAHRVASGAQELAAGSSKASAGADTLASGLGKLDDGAQQLSSGAQTLTTGLHTLQDGSATLHDGVSQLSTGAHTLATGLTSGVKRIPAMPEDQSQDAVSVLSAPVDVTMKVDNPATYYGRGLAPMFFSIALWVMGISAFFVVRPITGRVLAARGSNLRIGLSAWLSLGALSVIASWIMLGVAWLGLGLNPAHPWLLIALVTVVALSFSSVAHLMRTWVGFVATAVLLVLLILQLATAGGTYPPELLPPVFATIGHFMPMTYTIDAFRIAISGGLMSKFAIDLSLMVLLFVCCMGLLMWVVNRRRRFSMSDLHPPFD